jgi:hypothetical protein
VPPTALYEISGLEAYCSSFLYDWTLPARLRHRIQKLKCLIIHVLCDVAIDIEGLQNRLLKVCYVPATSASLPRLSFFSSFFLLWPLAVLMKHQGRQYVPFIGAIKQSILLRCLWI